MKPRRQDSTPRPAAYKSGQDRRRTQPTLLDQFREYYKGKATITMTELRQSYNLLMMKVLSLLQDADQKLASAVVSSREAIWDLLADPKKFAALQS